jgi:hypothetical protein
VRGAISYLDFDLLIRPSKGGYRAQVLSSPAGQASSDFKLPFSELELENFVLRIARPRRGTRRVGSPEMEAVKTLGKGLHEAVFNGEVRACWYSSMNEAEAKNLGLRLRLRIADAPELNELPWEYLYNASLNRFLSLSEYSPLIRYLDLPERIRPLAVDAGIEILVMISSPTDYPRLDVEGEWTRLNKALEGLVDNGQVGLKRLSESRLPQLQRELRRSQYHVLHYIGHAGFDRETEQGVLILCDEAGKGCPVAPDHLGTILHDHRSLRLVVLNACEGARSSRADPFSGVAQTLVQQGVPAVIAMQFEVTDAAALTLAEELYAATADGYPVDAALAAARKSIAAAGNDVEWGTPVLYLRAPDGQLFSLNRDERSAHSPTPRAADPPAAEGDRYAAAGTLPKEEQRLARAAEQRGQAEARRLFGKSGGRRRALVIASFSAGIAALGALAAHEFFVPSPDPCNLISLKNISNIGDVSGTYAGTYTATQAPGPNYIRLNLQQSGSNLSTDYRTSTGQFGNGTGTISGNIGTMTAHTTTPSCTGDFKGSYCFSKNQINFYFKGYDCLGLEKIEGQATRN